MLVMRLVPLVLTPYLPNPQALDINFTESKFDVISVDGVSRRAKVVNPIKKEHLDLDANDFSIKALKNAGLLDKLQPCSKIQLSPLECSDLVSEQIQVLSDKEISLTYKESLSKRLVNSTPAPASASAPASAPADSAE